MLSNIFSSMDVRVCRPGIHIDKAGAGPEIEPAAVQRAKGKLGLRINASDSFYVYVQAESVSEKLDDFQINYPAGTFGMGVSL